MNIKNLPFEVAEVEVLRFDPWTKKNDSNSDFIFLFDGKYFAVSSPYDWRSKKLVHGDIIFIKKVIVNERGKLIFVK